MLREHLLQVYTFIECLVNIDSNTHIYWMLREHLMLKFNFSSPCVLVITFVWLTSITLQNFQKIDFPKNLNILKWNCRFAIESVIHGFVETKIVWFAHSMLQAVVTSSLYSSCKWLFDYVVVTFPIFVTLYLV